MVSIKLPNVGVGEGIILNSSSDWDFGSGRGLVVGGIGGSMTAVDVIEEGGGGAGVGAAEEIEGGGWEEVESRCSRSCCCSNIFSRAVLHLISVCRGTLFLSSCSRLCRLFSFMYCSDFCVSSPSFLSILFIIRLSRGTYFCSSWWVLRYASFSSGVTVE